MKRVVWLSVVGLLGYVLFHTGLAHADLQLPSYAQSGNLEGELQKKGQNVTEIISLIVVMLSIIGILIGGGKIAMGNAEGGKQWVVGGIAGVIIAGSVYGIVALVA